MGSTSRESLEKRLQRLRLEKGVLREKMASLKKENRDLKRSVRERDILFNSQSSGIVLIQQGRILEINDIMLKHLGHGRQELIGRDFLDFVHPDQRADVRELHDMWVSGKVTPGQYDARILGRDDEIIDFEVEVRSIKFDRRKSFLLNLTRLEKRKEMERERLLSNKMEALATMAAGLAERLRFGNEELVSVVTGLRDAAQSGKGDLPACLKEIEDDSNGILTLSRKLEALARTEEIGHRGTAFDLNERVNNAITSVKERMKKRPQRRDVEIDLKTYLRASLPVKGEPEEIEEVIIQLITNAVEAMPNGGEVDITTEDNEGFCQIYIQDSGVGIAEGSRDRIYDPFFSTKGDDSMGLGLSITYAAVKRHGGAIEMSSREGQGTIFYIKIPLADRERKARPRADRKRIKESQVLIIQAEDVARELLCHLLTTRGCRVDTAMTGMEGLGKLKRKRFDLVIADTERLDMDGSVFVKTGKDITPGLLIVLIKGDEGSGGGVAEHESPADLDTNKPLDVKRFVREIATLLMVRPQRIKE